MIGHLGRELSPALTAMFTSSGAAVILGIVAVATGGLRLDQPLAFWLAVVLLAVVCTVIAFMLFLRGLATIGPVRTAIVSTVEPFWGAFLASVVLAQPLAARTMTGGVLVAAAVIILNLPQRSDAPAVA
jgi:drug/metabolite transporter (DMT)-like permease